MARRRSEEDALQIAAVELIRYKWPWVKCYHTPNGGKRGKFEGARFKRMGVLAGVPDLTILPGHGQVFYIELKTDKGTQRPEQIEFQEWCELYGYKYFLCRSLSEVEAAMEGMVDENP